MDFAEVVKFHGHTCPGLAMGYRVAMLAVSELDFERSSDEELVAIVENNSCAVDAVQAVVGCTFGKGNLIFKDYGKQVYTFIRRSDGESVRIAVAWQPPAEDEDVSAAWKKYRFGDRTPEVSRTVQQSKAAKVQKILQIDNADLFEVSKSVQPLPPKAAIHMTMTCSKCGEKVMAPMAGAENGGAPMCIPCRDEALRSPHPG